MKKFGKKNLRSTFVNIFCISLLLAVISTTHAEVVSRYAFNDANQEARFGHLTKILRCVVCQNQNLDESNASIANDLKQHIHDAIVAGQSDEVIVNNLHQRYGDYILFAPPMNKHTSLLWFGPLMILILGLYFLRRLFQK